MLRTKLKNKSKNKLNKILSKPSKIVIGKSADKVVVKKLPNAFRLLVQAYLVPSRHWKLFGGIMALFTVFNLALIGGLSQATDLQLVKESTQADFGHIFAGLTLYGVLINEGAGNAVSAYQSVLLLLISLVLIWSLRQVYAEHTVRVRDAFYNAMHPLVQFVIVLLVNGLRLLPALFGSFIFAALLSSGRLRGTVEVIVAGGVVFMLLAWTSYLLCSSVIALYIVTLPDMTPLAALRSGKEIVKARRGSVLRKLLFLPLALLVGSVIIMVPVLLLLTPAAPSVFFVLTVLAVLIVHSYMYALYRELIV